MTICTTISCSPIAYVIIIIMFGMVFTGCLIDIIKHRRDVWYNTIIGTITFVGIVLLTMDAANL